MSGSCAEWRSDIGAYIAGALDGPARDRSAATSRHARAAGPSTTTWSRSGPGSASWLPPTDGPSLGLPRVGGGRRTLRFRRTGSLKTGRIARRGTLPGGACWRRLPPPRLRSSVNW
jgi:hypothetical protein